MTHSENIQAENSHGNTSDTKNSVKKTGTDKSGGRSLMAKAKALKI